MKKTVWTGVCLLALVGLVWMVQAGVMEPPGPPGPTYKALPELEPRTPIYGNMLPLAITSSGSYYLAEDIDATGRFGITVAGDVSVTIDLNGFSLSNGLGTGIVAMDEFPPLYVAVRNGVVRGWDSHGIDLSNADVGVVTNVTAIDNASRGILLGYSGRVSNCVAISNGADGIVVGNAGSVEHSKAQGNANNGIRGGAYSTITNCFSTDNSQGIVVTEYSLVADNRCIFNGSNGIYVLGVGNIIDGNRLITINEYAIEVEAAGNILVRNIAHSEQAYEDDSATNQWGPIGSPSTATSPWANLEWEYL